MNSCNQGLFLFLEEKEPGNKVGAKLQCRTLCGLASVSFDKTDHNTCILLYCQLTLTVQLYITPKCCC